MPEGERVARLEERVELLSKHVDALAEDLRDRLDERFADLKTRMIAVDESMKERIEATEKALRETINGRIKDLDGKYILVKVLVFAFCGMVLSGFAAAVIASFAGSPLRAPTLPQPYTISPRGGG